MTRLEKLVNSLPENADGILLTSAIHRSYLTGHSCDGYVLVTRNAAYVLTDSRYIEAAKAAIPDTFKVLLQKGARAVYLGELFDAENVKTLLFENREMTVAAYDSLTKEFDKIAFVPADGLLEKLRECKDAEELANIKKAQSIAEAAFDHILGYISPDRTEVDVALELEMFMRSHGAKSISFSTIAVSGSASSQPHGVPRNIKLQKGFLTMDYGALVSGYCSDMTRTVCIGRADDEMKKVYNTVLTAQLAALEKAAVGVSCRELDKTARDIITEAGYGECFGHSLGHGVGMRVHEEPRLSPSSDSILKPGDVVTFEPGIYIEGKYGVRIEDMLYVHENGCENLTHVTKELIEL